jgi:arginine decarboxylase
MNIHVVSGIGTGKTVLSAFDNALRNAGVYNYNLIPLSSVIPPNSKVIKLESYITPESEFGHKLYVVKAEMRSNEVGKYIAAGIGWYQFGEDNRGVFVEHETIGDTKIAVEADVKDRIINSLKDLCTFREVAFDYKKANSVVAVSKVTNYPSSVLVLAIYQSEGWK